MQSEMGGMHTDLNDRKKDAFNLPALLVQVDGRFLHRTILDSRRSARWSQPLFVAMRARLHCTRLFQARGAGVPRQRQRLAHLESMLSPCLLQYLRIKSAERMGGGDLREWDTRCSCSRRRILCLRSGRSGRGRRSDDKEGSDRELHHMSHIASETSHLATTVVALNGPRRLPGRELGGAAHLRVEGVIEEKTASRQMNAM